MEVARSRNYKPFSEGYKNGMQTILKKINDLKEEYIEDFGADIPKMYASIYEDIVSYIKNILKDQSGQPAMMCIDCNLWKSDRPDGACIRYVNNTCPYGYHSEPCEDCSESCPVRNTCYEWR